MIRRGPAVRVEVPAETGVARVMIGDEDVSNLLSRVVIYVEATGQTMISLSLPLDTLSVSGAGAVLSAPTKTMLRALGWTEPNHG